MTSAYMDINAVGELLEGVKEVRRGKLIGRCPTHVDKSPSLTVTEGDKGTLLYCWAGCKTTDVVKALGIPIASLFKDAGNYVNESSSGVMKLREMQRARRAPTMRELAPAYTLEDVLWPILVADPYVWTWVRLRWADWLSMPLPEAMKKHYVVTDAICADLMVHDLDEGYDYTLDEKRRLRNKLEERWRQTQPVKGG